MVQNVDKEFLKKTARTAATRCYKKDDGISHDEAHKEIYKAVMAANHGVKHPAHEEIMKHAHDHLTKLKDGTMSEETLNEFDASDGISHTADPVAKDSKRKADKTGVNQPMPEFFTKVEAINQIMGHLSTLGKPELANIFKGLTDKGPHSGSGDSVMGKALATRNIGTSKDNKLAQSLKDMMYSPTSVKAIVGEDVDALFGGETLSEELREKTRTLFEAAVNAKLHVEVARLEEEFEANLVEALEEKITQLTDNVDKYLSYAVEQWFADNEIAIENGLKSEVVEDFMHGLKNLFIENYVEIPDDKIDLVTELSNHVAELEQKVNSVVKENIELVDYIDTLEVDKVFSEAVESLPLTQQEKLRSLVEGIEYSDVNEFTKKLNVIKETYFGAPAANRTVTLTEAADFDYDYTETTPVNDQMSHYVKAISQTTKK